MIDLRSNDALKFITLGYSTAGKTYFLGSLHTLTLRPGKSGFTMRGKDLGAMDAIEQTYRILARYQEGAIYTTPKTNRIKMILQQRINDLFEIEMSDIEGQATDLSNTNKEEAARTLITGLKEYDGVLIFVKAPNNEDELITAIGQLNRHLNLTSVLLRKKQNIPVALVISQIDRLPDLKQIKESIEQEYQRFEEEVRADYDSYEEIESNLDFARGDIINPYVGKAAKGPYINKLVAHFKRMLEGTKTENRPFMCSSLGFDNSVINPNLPGTDVAAGKQLHPYGTVAAFLWMIYAHQKINPSRMLNRKFDNSLLKSDLKDLYVSGQAYHDGSPWWNIRDL